MLVWENAWPAIVGVMTGGIGVELLRAGLGWATGRSERQRKTNAQKVRDYDGERRLRQEAMEYAYDLRDQLHRAGVDPLPYPPCLFESRKKDDNEK